VKANDHIPPHLRAINKYYRLTGFLNRSVALYIDSNQLYYELFLCDSCFHFDF
jgi:hypothetical protein